MPPRRWYSDLRGRLVLGSIGGEVWAAVTTFCITLSLLLSRHLPPIGKRGYILDAIGDTAATPFLVFLALVCGAHLVILTLPNQRRHIKIRKFCVVVETACWTSVYWQLALDRQFGSLPGLTVLLGLLYIAIARRRYPPL